MYTITAVWSDPSRTIERARAEVVAKDKEALLAYVALYLGAVASKITISEE